eukprot:gene44648-54598_t
MSGFFSIAKAMPKDDFLSLYRQVSTVTKLLFAPCGLADQTVDVAGLSFAQDVYKATLQQLEDMVSKLLFKHVGVEDDVIVASMHEYVGKGQDEEVLTEIRSSLEALQTLLVPPAVTPLPVCAGEGLSGQVAACLLDQVLSSLEL